MAAISESPPSPGSGTPDRETSRRDFLYLATGTALAAGAALAAWPFIDFMNPSADVLALSAVDVDLDPIAVGQRITVNWRGKPVFIVHRTAEEIARAEADDRAELIDPTPDGARVKQKEWLVVIGICTHLGCIPLGQKPADPRGQYGGWFCPCHGSMYDTAGRVRRSPAPRNLDLPPYRFLHEGTVQIG
ncbi:MAG: ubiquinol-cytochrome c reductase iron-sulfur subunit [Proteobacteria bacterium]|nr:ubiquinol-cytochrome c reductase iron-sulfur subunit [Pseudomonadota bacterium]